MVKNPNIECFNLYMKANRWFRLTINVTNKYKPMCKAPTYRCDLFFFIFFVTYYNRYIVFGHVGFLINEKDIKKVK